MALWLIIYSVQTSDILRELFEIMWMSSSLIKENSFIINSFLLRNKYQIIMPHIPHTSLILVSYFHPFSFISLSSLSSTVSLPLTPSLSCLVWPDRSLTKNQFWEIYICGSNLQCVLIVRKGRLWACGGTLIGAWLYLCTYLNAWRFIAWDLLLRSHQHLTTRDSHRYCNNLLPLILILFWAECRNKHS